MYLFAQRPEQNLAVWLLESASPDEWALHLQHMRELAGWSTNGRRAAVILFMPSLSSVPDSSAREALAEISELPGYDPYLAFVTPNRAANTALILLSWLQRRPSYEPKFVTALEDALAWLEQRQQRPLPTLREMAEDVLRRAQNSAHPGR